jgi:HEPN domain-containing protein
VEADRRRGHPPGPPRRAGAGGLTRTRKTSRVEPQEARHYAAKAREFLEEARAAAGAGRHDAALLIAVHAAIAAVDAVTAAIGGRRSTDPDHRRAADLLLEVAGPSEEVRARARQLAALLGKKNLVEYESRRATAREASEAVDRAARIVEWSATMVERGRV